MTRHKAIVLASYACALGLGWSLFLGPLVYSVTKLFGLHAETFAYPDAGLLMTAVTTILGTAGVRAYENTKNGGSKK